MLTLVMLGSAGLGSPASAGIGFSLGLSFAICKLTCGNFCTKNPEWMEKEENPKNPERPARKNGKDHPEKPEKGEARWEQ